LLAFQKSWPSTFQFPLSDYGAVSDLRLPTYHPHVSMLSTTCPHYTMANTCPTLTPANTLYKYEPDYLPRLMDRIDQDGSQENLDAVSKEAGEKNWITNELREYLTQFYPQPGQLSKEGLFSGVRDKAAFVEVCKIVFPTGRIFSSSKQLEQAVKLFLDKWGCKATVQGKQLQCAFSPPPQPKTKIGQTAYKRVSWQRHSKTKSQMSILHQLPLPQVSKRNSASTATCENHQQELRAHMCSLP
jgi:hypothetical protein